MLISSKNFYFVAFLSFLIFTIRNAPTNFINLMYLFALETSIQVGSCSLNNRDYSLFLYFPVVIITIFFGTSERRIKKKLLLKKRKQKPCRYRFFKISDCLQSFIVEWDKFYAVSKIYSVILYNSH